jgi:hypothetical protein
VAAVSPWPGIVPAWERKMAATPRCAEEARSVAEQLARLLYCRQRKRCQLQDRNWPVSWVGDTGIEPVTSSV